jgi:hypothetical protein
MNGHVYLLRSYHLVHGVYSDKLEGFIGVREKHGPNDRFLSFEYHYNCKLKNGGYGTARPLKDLGTVVPENIPLVVNMPGNWDRITGREVNFDAVRGWCFIGTDENSEKISPHVKGNDSLFRFLENMINE